MRTVTSETITRTVKISAFVQTNFCLRTLN